MSADSDPLDYPDTGGSLVLVHRAIDYLADIEMGRDTQAAYGRYVLQEARTLKYASRRNDENIVMGAAAGRVRTLTKIVGDDDV
jgi:hypothetical protein